MLRADAKNNFTSSALTTWRGHSCLPGRDSSRPFSCATLAVTRSVETSLDAADTSVRATSVAAKLFLRDSVAGRWVKQGFRIENLRQHMPPRTVDAPRHARRRLRRTRPNGGRLELFPLAEPALRSDRLHSSLVPLPTQALTHRLTDVLRAMSIPARECTDANAIRPSEGGSARPRRRVPL